MEAHAHYRHGHFEEAFVTYALLAELGYEVAQSNAAFVLDRGNPAFVACQSHRLSTEPIGQALFYSPFSFQVNLYPYSQLQRKCLSEP